MVSKLVSVCLCVLSCLVLLALSCTVYICKKEEAGEEEVNASKKPLIKMLPPPLLFYFLLFSSSCSSAFFFAQTIIEFDSLIHFGQVLCFHLQSTTGSLPGFSLTSSSYCDT